MGTTDIEVQVRWVKIGFYRPREYHTTQKNSRHQSGAEATFGNMPLHFVSTHTIMVMF